MPASSIIRVNQSLGSIKTTFTRFAICTRATLKRLHLTIDRFIAKVIDAKNGVLFRDKSLKIYDDDAHFPLVNKA